jgi:sulfite reductase alpha subunit-like flavoprotein
MVEIDLVTLAVTFAIIAAIKYIYDKYIAYQPGYLVERKKPSSTNNAKSNNNSSNNLSGKKHLPMSIFFGTQSGTAETFAGELCEEAKIYGYAAKVHDLEDYDKDELINEKYAVFLIATFGEGTVTEIACDDSFIYIYILYLPYNYILSLIYRFNPEIY